VKKRRSPQEKKALSYAKDRRNTYGENQKSSRKNIPLSKAKGHRALRRGAKLALERDPLDDTIQTNLPKPKWRKWSDTSLGRVLVRRDTRRVFDPSEWDRQDKEERLAYAKRLGPFCKRARDEPY